MSVFVLLWGIAALVLSGLALYGLCQPEVTLPRTYRDRELDCRDELERMKREVGIDDDAQC